MSRILVLVPNIATKDRRVLRQTKSLMDQGHEVEIVGITTNDAPGTRAISDEGIPVTRVQWRAESYVETAKIYARRLMIGFLILMGMVAGTILLTTLIVPRSLQRIIEILMPEWSQGIAEVGYQFIAIGLVALFLVGLLLAIRVARKILMRFGRLSELSKMRKTAENYSALEENYEAEPRNLRERILGLLGNPQALSFRSAVKVRCKNMLARAEEFQPDIIYCHEVMTLPVGTAAKKKFGCKVIYDAHEIYDGLAHAEPYILATYAELHAKHLQNVDLMIAVNPRILQYYTETYEVKATSLVMPNTVFRDEGMPYDNRMHEKAGLSDDAQILLYQGGFSMNRGLESIIEAGYLLPENWYLVMMGWGRLKEELIELSETFKTQLKSDLTNKMLAERRKSPEFVTKFQNALASIEASDEEKVREDIFDAITISHDRAVEASGGAATSHEQNLKTFAAQKLVDETLKSGSGRESFEGMIDVILDMDKTIDKANTKRSLEGTSEAYQGGRFQLARDIVSRDIRRDVRIELERMEVTGLLDKVRFIRPAPHDELVEWTKGADIGIVPYLNTGLNHWFCSPNKMFEYPNAGVPIIASRMMFLNETIERTDIGWTMPSDFVPEDIPHVIKRVTEDDLAFRQQACHDFMDAHHYLVYEPQLLKAVEQLAAGELRKAVTFEQVVPTGFTLDVIEKAAAKRKVTKADLTTDLDREPEGAVDRAET